jgi:hypothetical protein
MDGKFSRTAASVVSWSALAYFEGAEEFLSLATEFLRRHDA